MTSVVTILLSRVPNLGRSLSQGNWMVEGCFEQQILQI